MKTIIAGFTAALVLSASVHAQDGEGLLSKNGRQVLPERGDIGLGFNAVPVLGFFGNMFNGNMNNAFAGQNKFASALGSQTIFGKYFLESNRAIRAHFQIQMSGSTLGNYVFDDTQNSPQALVLDRSRNHQQTYILGGGYEFRRGHGRVQGFYGAEAFFMYGRNTTDFSYGNAFGVLNSAPTSTTDFASGTAAPQGERTSFINNGSSFGMGIRPFIGVEYFFAPKISIGGEFGWNLMYNVTFDGESTTERFDVPTESVIRRNTPVSGNNGFNLNTDNFNGALFLMFYF
jgi:hypothetical protein